MHQLWVRAVLAIGLAMLSAVLVSSYLGSLEQRVDVVVAARDITLQTVLQQDMVEIRSVNREAVGLLAASAARDPQVVIGSIALRNIKAGEPLSIDGLQLIDAASASDSGQAEASDAARVASGSVNRALFLEKGMRAMSIRVDAQGSLGFTLKKGDKVDVIYTSTSGETGGLYSITLLQDIMIFEVEEMSSRLLESGSSSAQQTITLAVTPDQAQKLALAKRKGEIDLTLRAGVPGFGPANTGRNGQDDIIR